ncbi:MAG: cobaltochelatase subunit CobN, partial [Coleofasciculus sp. C2-GNP5-27]
LMGGGGGSFPIVGILLYRKHVVSKQPYIPQLIRQFENAGLIPVPIFINGVEGHVAVRDWLTSTDETAQRQQGKIDTPSLSKDAVEVDAIVSTIGFPLVGGPAGSMEAGRQVEVAKRILTAKNVPYLVAAPLLIQDIHSWTRQGVGGLQSVVLY